MPAIEISKIQELPLKWYCLSLFLCVSLQDCFSSRSGDRCSS